MDSFRFRDMVAAVMSLPQAPCAANYAIGWRDACNAVLEKLDGALRNAATADADAAICMNARTLAGLATDVSLNKPPAVSMLPQPTRTPAMPPVAPAQNYKPAHGGYASGGFDIPPDASPTPWPRDREHFLPAAVAEQLRARTARWLEDNAGKLAEAVQVTVHASSLNTIARHVPIWLSFDRRRDELVIHGKRYAAALFSGDGLLAEPGCCFEVTMGAEDQVTVKLLGERYWLEQAGADRAREGVQEVSAGFDDIAFEGQPEGWSEKPFARISFYSDDGDDSVGQPGRSGWTLASDQAGTVVEELARMAGQDPRAFGWQLAMARSLDQAHAERDAASAALEASEEKRRAAGEMLMDLAVIRELTRTQQGTMKDTIDAVRAGVAAKERANV